MRFDIEVCICFLWSWVFLVLVGCFMENVICLCVRVCVWGGVYVYTCFLKLVVVCNGGG